MDPVIWSWVTCTWLIQTCVSGILGNQINEKATEVWKLGWQAFDQKLRTGHNVANPDLAVAVHRAFLLAQRSLVCDCLEEFTGGTWVEGMPNTPMLVDDHLQDEVDWLRGRLKEIKANLQKLQKGDYDDIPLQELETAAVLLQGTQMEQTGDVERKLRQTLADTVLAGDLPAYQQRALAEGKGLYERISVFFAFELKTNEVVRRLFQNQLLVQINKQLKALSVQPLTLEMVERRLEKVARDLPKVLAQLRDLELAIQDMGRSLMDVSWLVASKVDSLMGIATTHAGDLAEVKRLLAQLVESIVPPQRSGPSLLRQEYNRKGPNPFTYGPTVSPERFYGRKSNRADIRNRIGGFEPQSINIVGLRRNGKSSLLRYVKERIDEFCVPEQKPLVVLLDLQDRRFRSPVGILEGIRRRIKEQVGIEPWQQREDNDLFYVEDGLEALRNRGYRLIVMFDEFEALGGRLEVFQDWGDDWRAKASAGLVTLVIASKQEVSKLYQGLNLTSPFGNIFSTTVLGGLELEAWKSLMKSGDLAGDEMQWVNKFAGCLPFYAQMAASIIWQYGSLELAQKQFWKQAQPRFEEIWKNLQHPERQVIKEITHEKQIDSLLKMNYETFESLKLYGLMNADGRLFCSAFCTFVERKCNYD